MQALPSHRPSLRRCVSGLAVCLAAGLLAPPGLAGELPLHTLLPAGSGAAAFAGLSSALSGDVLALGEPGFDLGAGNDHGRVTVFRYDGSDWLVDAVLLAPPDAVEERFGTDVALSPDADTLAVGAYEYGLGGAVFVFEHGPGGWTLAQTVVPADLAADDHFGEAVALTDELLVCGAPYRDEGFASARGGAYVFRRDGAGLFQEEALLLASDGGAADLYGSAVDVDGETIIVGAWNDDFSGTGIRMGSAYVLRHDGAQWLQLKNFKPLNLSVPGGEFGRSVAVDGQRVLVGAPLDDAFDMDQRGAVFVFSEGAGDWPLEQELFASDGAAGHQFGRSLALDGEVAVVGAWGAGPLGAGAGYAFRLDGGGWTQSDILADPDGVDGDALGSSASLQGDLVLLGAFGRDGPAGINQGAGFVFDVLDPVWSWRGRGLAGVDGTPVLSPAGELTAGSSYEWSVEHAAPSAALVLVLGLSEVGLPLKGGVLVPAPDVLLAGLFTDAAGELLLGGSWPAGLPSGPSFVLQAWISDAAGPAGFSATHGVSGTLP